MTLPDIQRLLRSKLPLEYSVATEKMPFGKRLTITHGRSAGCYFMLCATSFYTLKPVPESSVIGSIAAFLPDKTKATTVWFFAGVIGTLFLYKDSKRLVAEMAALLEAELGDSPQAPSTETLARD